VPVRVHVCRKSSSLVEQTHQVSYVYARTQTHAWVEGCVKRAAIGGESNTKFLVCSQHLRIEFFHVIEISIVGHVQL